MTVGSENTKPIYKQPNKKPIYTKWWFWVLVVLVLLLLINQQRRMHTQPEAAKSAPQSPMQVELSKSIAVDYLALHQEYMDNAIGADAKYKDKLLNLTGMVGTIDREIAGEPYITFEISPLKDIRIDFNKSEEPKVANLKKGSLVTIVGRCDGTLLSTSVVLRDCYIVDQADPQESSNATDVSTLEPKNVPSTDEKLTKIQSLQERAQKKTFMLEIAQNDLESYTWGEKSAHPDIWQQAYNKYNFTGNYVMEALNSDVDVYIATGDSEYALIWAEADYTYEKYISGELKSSLPPEQYQHLLDELNAISKRLGFIFAKREYIPAEKP